MHEYISSVFTQALETLSITGVVLTFEKPKTESHGDVATNVAMVLAKQLAKPPRQIAQSILDAIELDSTLVESVEIAGAGFINIRYTPLYYTNVLRSILEAGESFGKGNRGIGKSANVEYVSANPTGMLHPGHGRNIMLGDGIANLLEWSSYKVTREYYFNNAGNQMNNLARSVYARYRQQLGESDFPFDEENGYKGEYISTIAAELINEYGDSLQAEKSENLMICRKKGEIWCFASITETLKTFGIKHDVFFNEQSLYESGAVDDVVRLLKEKGLAYEKDGATWIATEKLGLEKDKVIVKSTGEPTYRLPDMAYHCIKCERGDDVIVDIFGADHIATVQEVLAGVKALGYDTEKISVVLHQMVSFVKEGKPYKLSKRNGEQYTLDDLIQDLGADVVRFFFSMRSADTQLVFDIDLAMEQSDKNPVFYLQYAHARCANIRVKAAEKSISILSNNAVNIQLLIQKAEIDLIKALERFPTMVEKATIAVSPHIIADYLREVAAAIHVFYHECNIINAEDELRQARFALAYCAQVTLRNGLHILGVSAPESMHRSIESVQE